MSETHQSCVAKDLLRKLVSDPMDTLMLERFGDRGMHVIVDTSWVAITDDEAALLEELCDA